MTEQPPAPDEPDAEAADTIELDDLVAKEIRARLNPDLTDSPLRRALRAAGLEAPFGVDTTPPPAPTPSEPESDS